MPNARHDRSTNSGRASARSRANARSRAKERIRAERSESAFSQDSQHSRLLSQARAVNVALMEVWTGVFRENRPADRVLNLFFRSHRQYGAQDRRLVSESIYSVFRWWGFLRRLLPPELTAELENRAGDPGAPLPRMRNEDTSAIILGAWLLEQKPLPDLVAVWCDSLEIAPEELEKELSGAADYLEAASKMFPLLRRRLGGGSARLTPLDLLPEWVPAMLPPEIDAFNLVNWVQRRPPMWLRAQCHDVDVLVEQLRNYGLPTLRQRNMDQALRIDNAKVNLFTLAEFRGGLFEVQDLASQVIGIVASPCAGERWWDACAGAGGKTLQLADLMQRKGTVIASDIRGYKLDDLKLRARRAGFPNITTKEWDGKPLRKKQRGNYDGVLVDAPCTCSGTWRRNPDARWTLLKAEVAEMAALQSGILRSASTGVRSGGILIYATCSLFAAENYGVVEKFLAENPDFKLDPFSHPLTGRRCEGMLQVYPWDGDCDAMFVARMRRSENAVPAE